MKKRLLALIPVMLVVFLCSGNVFARVYPQYIRTATFTGLDTGSDSNITAYQLYGNLDVYDYEQPELVGSTSYPRWLYAGGSTDIVITGYIRNTTYVPMFCSGVTITLTDTSGNTVMNMNGFNYLYGDLRPSFTTAGNLFNLVPTDNIAFEQGFIVAPMSTVYFAFSVSSYYTVNGTSGNITLSSVSGNVTYSAHSEVWEGHYGYTVDYGPLISKLESMLTDTTTGTTIFDIVYELKSAYDNNATGSQSVTQESSGLTTQSNQIHQDETNYFSSTNTAIGNTGLGNYQFAPDVATGLGIVKTQFGTLWNKLGAYVNVFIFSLTLSLALMIIRHVRPIKKGYKE